MSTPELTPEQFAKHLGGVSEILSTWPQWKLDLLGINRPKSKKPGCRGCDAREKELKRWRQFKGEMQSMADIKDEQIFELEEKLEENQAAYRVNLKEVARLIGILDKVEELLQNDVSHPFNSEEEQHLCHGILGTVQQLRAKT